MTRRAWWSARLAPAACERALGGHYSPHELCAMGTCDLRSTIVVVQLHYYAITPNVPLLRNL